MKLCKICGKEFIPEHNAQRICKADHYAKCPVCSKLILWNSTKPVRTCSRQCGDQLRAASMISRYGAENAMKSAYVVNARKQKWIDKVHELLPLKLDDTRERPHFMLLDDQLEIYCLTETASKSFLTRYGFRPKCKFGKIHQSIGLVNDGILYQVIRFERHKDEIVLANFGTREGYANPNQYSKLISFAVNDLYIDSFVAEIPRQLATDQLLSSMSLEKVQEGEYEVYWKIDGDLILLNKWHDISAMLDKYDYITTDYLDKYQFVQRKRAAH